MGSPAKTEGEGFCPICGHARPPRADNRVFPFCSERCQMVDLSRWLAGEYRIPETELDYEGFGDGAHFTDVDER